MMICRVLALSGLGLLSFIVEAAACSPAPPWYDSGVRLLGASWDEEIDVPADGRLLLTINGGDGIPSFPEFVAMTTITIAHNGTEVEGTLTPSPLHGQYYWQADGRLASGRYTLTSVIDVRGGEPREVVHAFTVTPHRLEPALPTVVVTSSAQRVDVLGECMEDSRDSCGGCGSFEVLGEQKVFDLSYIVELPDLGWETPYIARFAIGTTGVEAQEIVQRTPFSRLRSGELTRGGIAYDLWPLAQACTAYEIRDPWGEIALAEVKCLEIPDEPELGQGIDGFRPIEPQTERPIAEPPIVEPPITSTKTMDNGGCTQTDGPGHSWFGLLLLVGIFNKRRG